MKFDNAPELLHKYLSYALTIQNKSLQTVNEYYLDIRLFLKYLYLTQNANMKKIEDIDEKYLSDELIKTATIDDMTNFMFYLTYDRQNNPEIRSRRVSSLRSFYTYLSSNIHVIETNPSLALEKPKERKRLPVYLTLEEAQKLLEHCEKEGRYKERNYCIVVFFLNCGMRLSELVNININDIRENTLTVTGKGNKQRTLMLNDICVDALSKYLKVRIKPCEADKNALFTSRNRKRISNRMVQKLITESIAATGLSRKYTTHKLRHTAGTLMFQQGQDSRTIQNILGHESISSTQIYTHVSSSQMHKALSSHPLNQSFLLSLEESEENKIDG